jgi:hypothetical protein
MTKLSPAGQKRNTPAILTQKWTLTRSERLLLGTGLTLKTLVQVKMKTTFTVRRPSEPEKCRVKRFKSWIICHPVPSTASKVSRYLTSKTMYLRRRCSKHKQEFHGSQKDQQRRAATFCPCQRFYAHLGRKTIALFQPAHLRLRRLACHLCYPQEPLQSAKVGLSLL